MLNQPFESGLFSRIRGYFLVRAVRLGQARMGCPSARHSVVGMNGEQNIVSSDNILNMAPLVIWAKERWISLTDGWDWRGVVEKCTQLRCSGCID